MKIISLSASHRGYACSVATNIKSKYYNNNFETNLFDILITSLESINQMFNFDIEKLELIENFDIPIWKTTDESEFFFKDFDYILSTHSLKKIYTFDEFNEMINKYKRRYYRFFNNIKNENQIFFIRYGIESEKEIKKFIKNIKIINPKLKFYFISIFFDKKHKYSFRLRLNKHFKFFNFYKFIDLKKEYNPDTYVRLIEYDWTKIFNFINKKKI